MKSNNTSLNWPDSFGHRSGLNKNDFSILFKRLPHSVVADFEYNDFNEMYLEVEGFMHLLVNWFWSFLDSSCEITLYHHYRECDDDYDDDYDEGCFYIKVHGKSDVLELKLELCSDEDEYEEEGLLEVFIVITISDIANKSVGRYTTYEVNILEASRQLVQFIKEQNEKLENSFLLEDFNTIAKEVRSAELENKYETLFKFISLLANSLNESKVNTLNKYDDDAYSNRIK